MQSWWLLIGRHGGLQHVTYHLLHLPQSLMGGGWSELLQQEVPELKKRQRSKVVVTLVLDLDGKIKERCEGQVTRS